MKNQTNLFIQLLLINLLLISCYHHRQSEIVSVNPSNPIFDGNLLVFDLKSMPDRKTVKLSEIGAVEINYIPLDSYLPIAYYRINNVMFSKSYFLVYGYSEVSMFRYDGSFVTKVGTRGRGPSEYLGVSDIDIDNQNESIYIAAGNKFLIYDKNGKFIRSFDFPKSDQMHFKLTKDGILCYYNNDMADIKYSYILIDTIGTIIKYYPNRYIWKRKGPGLGYQWENLFYKFNNQIYKKEIYCDTVFSFENKVFKPHIVINVDKLRLTPEIRSSIVTKPDFSVTTQNNYITPWNLLEFGNFVFYMMSVPLNGSHNLMYFIGSKTDDFRALVTEEQGLINDLDGGPVFKPKTIKNDSTLVAWIDAIEFKKYIESETFKNSTPKSPQKKKELEILANSLKETDNPVLMMVRLKK